MREIYICKEFNNLLEGLANFKNLYPHKMQFNIYICVNRNVRKNTKGSTIKKNSEVVLAFRAKLNSFEFLKKKGTDNVLARIFTAPG